MESIQRLRRTIAVGAALSFLLLPAAALAELANWDQARVTQTAEEFATAMKDLRKEMQAAPPMTDPTRQRALYVALDDIRIMTNTATVNTKAKGNVVAGVGAVDDKFVRFLNGRFIPIP